jgi:hypothetical protein
MARTQKNKATNYHLGKYCIVEYILYSGRFGKVVFVFLANLFDFISKVRSRPNWHG